MAFLIPENVRNDRTIPAAHRRVATALAIGLDDTATAWFEPPFDPEGTLPDFVVLDPSLGVLVVVVFGDEVIGTVGGKLRIADSDAEADGRNPLDAANEFGMRLRTLIAENPRLAMVPVGGVAVFPNLDRARAEALGVDTVLNLDHALFKPDLDAAIRAGDEAIINRRFLKILEGGPAERLSDATVDELRGLIHPDIVIRPAADQGSLFAAVPDGGDVIAVMDRKQERLAKGLGTGHRIIRGVAGSGKTLVLVHRARLLARILPTKQILVTCFTRSLASQLRSQLAEFDNIEVINVNKLMTRAIRDAGLEMPKDGNRIAWNDVSARALEAIRTTNRRRFRAVLIDEAQDFDTEALAFCVELLEATDPDEQDLIVVGDSAQNIFRKEFRWKDAGIKAQGRTRILRVNYRNTRQILAFAHDFLTADPDIAVDEVPDFDDELTIIPAESAERDGPEPIVVVTADSSSEIDEVVAQIREWYTPRMRARSIAVLMAEPRSDSRAQRIIDALEAAGIGVFWVTDPDHDENKDLAGSVDEPVILSTIHSAKGLEFPNVVVCGLGSPNQAGNDRLSARKLLYVGFTRAIDRLAVVTTSDNVFRNDLSTRSRALSPAIGVNGEASRRDGASHSARADMMAPWHLAWGSVVDEVRHQPHGPGRPQAYLELQSLGAVELHSYQTQMTESLGA